MKKMKWMAVIVAALVLISFAIADAQWGGRGRWPAWSANYYHWNWNPATVETIKGEVMTKDILIPPEGRGWYPAVGLTLKKEDFYAVYVHLGLEWYMDKQDLDINVGDKIEVTGSKIIVEGETSFWPLRSRRATRPGSFETRRGFLTGPGEDGKRISIFSVLHNRYLRTREGNLLENLKVTQEVILLDRGEPAASSKI